MTSFDCPTLTCPPSVRLALLSGLLLLAGCGEDGPPGESAGAGDPTTEPVLFEDANRDLGVEFSHDAGRTGRYFMPEMVPPGVALFDFDRDGDLDLYLVNSGSLDDRGQPAPDSNVANRLYRQNPDGQFEDVSGASGLADTGYGMGVAVGDLNNDGYPDLYLSNFGPDRLYLNNRDGTFVDVTAAAGIDNSAWTTSVALADFDRDGWLDLYVTNYVDYRADTKCPDNSGRPDYCGPHVFHGQPDRLYRNLGVEPAGDDGLPGPRFADVSATAGISRQGGPGLGVVCADFDDDGWPDIYVANDHAANFLWINARDGTFREEAFFRGGALSAQGRPQASMGIACGDIDGNGRIDLLLTHLEGENNALYLGVDETGFRESSHQAGLAMPSLGFTGFGTQFLDLDNDGDLDLLVANGRVRRVTRKIESSPDESVPEFWKIYAERNHLFLNDGAGNFSQCQNRNDPLLSRVEVSRGLATGDLDNDGDLDVVIGNTAGPVRIYRNQAADDRHWLIVRAVLPDREGRMALGARVKVTAGDTARLRLVQPASSYLSSSDPRVHFGLGDVDRVTSIEVDWPDGTHEVFSGGEADRIVTVSKGTGQESKK